MFIKVCFCSTPGTFEISKCILCLYRVCNVDTCAELHKNWKRIDNTYLNLEIWPNVNILYQGIGMHCAFHLTFDCSTPYHYGVCPYARVHDWYANRKQISWYWFSKFIDLGMSASHSPAIGDKPIELLMNVEQCDFGRGLIIFGRGLKFCAHA